MKKIRFKEAKTLALHHKGAEPELTPRSGDDKKIVTWDENTITHRAKVASAERMSKFLRHFTIVGDGYHAWNINYKK